MPQTDTVTGDLAPAGLGCNLRQTPPIQQSRGAVSRRTPEEAQRRRFFYKVSLSPSFCQTQRNPPTTMVLDSETVEHFRSFHFDGTLLELGPEQETFFKVETGIQDPEELRKHIADVHEEAYKVSSPLLARG